MFSKLGINLEKQFFNFLYGKILYLNKKKFLEQKKQRQGIRHTEL